MKKPVNIKKMVLPNIPYVFIATGDKARTSRKACSGL